jgi:hypothetical protein
MLARSETEGLLKIQEFWSMIVMITYEGKNFLKNLQCGRAGGPHGYGFSNETTGD